MARGLSKRSAKEPRRKGDSRKACDPAGSASGRARRRQVVGTAIAGYDGHRGWLYSVAVRLSYRRQGIGVQLVQEAEARLRAIGCSKLNLQVRAENSAVVNFYRSLGFEVEERISLGKRLRD